MQSGHIHHIAGYHGRRETGRYWKPFKGDFKIGGNPIERVGGAVKTAGVDIGKFAWTGIKQNTSFMLNAVTLGGANRFTSVSKWGKTGIAGKAGTVVGWTAAAVAAGYGAAGLFAPSATGVGTVAAEGASVVSAEAGGGMFALEEAAGSMVAWAEPAAGSTGILSTGAGAVASILPSKETLFGAGILSKIFQSGGEAIGGKAGEYVNQVFGGNAGAPGNTGGSGGGGGFDPGGGMVSKVSKLPFILIILLIGALLLTRKGRK